PRGGRAGGRLVVRARRKDPAPELLATIRDAAERAGVRSCFLADGAFGAGTPHLVIGIEPGALDTGDAARLIGDAAQPVLRPGAPLDVVPLDDDLLTTMRQLGPPLLDADADGA